MHKKLIIAPVGKFCGRTDLPINKFANLNLIGSSAVFLQAMKLIDRFSTCDATALILGETGTGKELAARAIHYLSDRRDGPFVPINCGAIPDSLVESEFFGHTKGAFTDARESRQGLVMQAQGGTLFLDEIEAMSPRAQGVLLRFLQDKEYRPVGGTAVQNANVRVIGASNVNLYDQVRQGLFRSDLLFRLNTLSFELPPLRKRVGDVMLLTQEFLARLNHQAGLPCKVLHPDSIGLLEAYDWPGNIRELENLLQREFILEEGTVIKICNPACSETCLFYPEMSNGSESSRKENLNSGAGNAGSSERRHQDRRRTAFKHQASSVSTNFQFIPETPNEHQLLTYEDFKDVKQALVTQLERDHLIALLTRTRGNLSLASRLSGHDRSDLCKLLKRHGLDRQYFTTDVPSTNSVDRVSHDFPPLLP
jgi:DNA-binding NtrC family response regulator